MPEWRRLGHLCPPYKLTFSAVLAPHEKIRDLDWRPWRILLCMTITISG
jgi:hypothetical protein